MLRLDLKRPAGHATQLPALRSLQPRWCVPAAQLTSQVAQTRSDVAVATDHSYVPVSHGARTLLQNI